MSSLRDIMDIDDTDPLPYRKAQAAQHISTLTPNDNSATSPPPSLEDTKGKTVIQQRRANQVVDQGGQSSSSLTNSDRRRSSATGDAMDYSMGYQAGGSNQASTSGSPAHSSLRGSEMATEVPVKYTPVTGRISRAKKGVPVHTCDLCRPVKTFTRAEHLRRHQLSHQKPAYPCTYRDCERAFHRPDLLARHQQRHETHKSPASGRNPSSSPGPSRGRTPPLKVEPPSQIPGESSTAGQTSPTDSDITPRTSGGLGNSMAAFAPTPESTFHSEGNFSPATSHKRSREEALGSETDPYSTMTPEGSRAAPNYGGHIHTYSSNSGTDLTRHSYGQSLGQGFNSMYETPDNAFSNNFVTSPIMPRISLRIPGTDEGAYYSGMSRTQDNSPFPSSSASDSTYSTQSERSHWGSHRGRSGSNAGDWASGVPFSPHSGLMTTPQELRNSQFDSILDHYNTNYTPPQSTPPTAPRHLEIPGSSPYVYTYMEPVGTPALSNFIPKAQIFSASPTGISDSRLGGVDRRQKMEPSQQFGALSIASNMVSSFSRHSPQLDVYISSYWNSFHQRYPIVHKGTFNPDASSFLTNAIAAIGTQYHDSVEARKEGMEMNELCKKNIGTMPMWNDLSTMQGIVLTEMFSRFRGRKTNVKLSEYFEEIYKRLLSHPTLPHSPYLSHTPVIMGLEDQFSAHSSTAQHHLHDSNQEAQHQDWLEWIRIEARQRLLSFCFIFDVLQSIYQQQNRSKAHHLEGNVEVHVPCADDLWDAEDATQWKLLQRTISTQTFPLRVVELDYTGQYTVSRSFLSQVLSVCSLASQFPSRDAQYFTNYNASDPPHSVLNLRGIFPNFPMAHAFLSLHYTPLYDLLAVAGDTWVFARKITPPSAFPEAQRRLKEWSSSLAAAVATQYACEYLRMALSTPYTPSTDDQVQSYTGNSFCISDYWPLYTSALICWAFGHHRQPYPSVSRSSSATAINTAELDADSPDTPVASEDTVKAFTYINGMLNFASAEEMVANKAGVRGETAGVIDSVRLRLEQIGIGNKCMTIVDAVGVLNKLNASGRSKFF